MKYVGHIFAGIGPLHLASIFVALAGALLAFYWSCRFISGWLNRRRDASLSMRERLFVASKIVLDEERYLALVRRDEVEHLLLIGGSQDFVIESNIPLALNPTGVKGSSDLDNVLQDKFSPPPSRDLVGGSPALAKETFPQEPVFTSFNRKEADFNRKEADKEEVFDEIFANELAKITPKKF